MSETIKELLISIKNGLESGDFEKTLDNCRTLNERKPDYSKGWWFTLLAENGVKGGKELAAKGGDFYENEAYKNALKYASEEEKAKYEKVARVALRTARNSGETKNSEISSEIPETNLDTLEGKKTVSANSAESERKKESKQEAEKECASYRECLEYFTKEQERVKNSHRELIEEKNAALEKRRDCLLKLKNTDGGFFGNNLFIFLLKTFYILFPFLAAAVIMKLAGAASAGVYAVLIAGAAVYVIAFIARLIKYCKRLGDKKEVFGAFNAAEESVAAADAKITEIRIVRKKLKNLTMKLKGAKSSEKEVERLKRRFDSVLEQLD